MAEKGDAIHNFRPDIPNPASASRPGHARLRADDASAPVVSIVTPFFNTGPVFAETALSIARQTFLQWEWIIVNDGSDDPQSLALLDGFRTGDTRIRVVDLARNSGPGAARNRGFAEAAGRYVFQLDSDDLAEPTAVETLYWYLETHPEMAFAKGYTVGFGAESYIWVNGFHFAEAFLDGNRADTIAMIRTDVARSIGYDESNTDGLEDWEFWVACAAAGYWGGTVHEPLGWVRRRSSHSGSWANWDDGPREEAFRIRLTQRYPALFDGGFPDVRSRPEEPSGFNAAPPPAVNRSNADASGLLMLVPWLEVGGADRINRAIVGWMIGAGWHVSVVTTLPAPNAWESEFRLLTADVFVMDRFLAIDERVRFISYLIESRSIDVVMISNSWFGYDVVPMLRRMHPECAFVDLTHAEEEWNDGGYPRLSCEYRNSLDLRIAGSAHLKAWMEERCGSDPSVEVWYGGIDTAKFAPDQAARIATRQELGVTGSQTVLLFVGRLAPEKQPLVFVDVVRSVSQRGHDVVGIVVGDGELRGALNERIVDAQDSAPVHVENSAGDERVLDLMRAADVLVMPSLREGVAVATYEAMAAGLVVVATEVGAQDELIAHGAGVLIPDPSGHDLAERIASAVENLIVDPEVREAMSSTARTRVVERFSSDRARDRIAGLLADVGARHRDGSEGAPPDGYDENAVFVRHKGLETQQLYTLSLREPSGLPGVDAGRTLGYRILRRFYRSIRRIPGLGRPLERLARRVGGS